MANYDYSGRPGLYISPKVLREFEQALNNPPEPEWPSLVSGRSYAVRSRAFVETSEGYFEPVNVEFAAKFSHWYSHYAEPGPDRHGKDIAVFSNKVYIGPRKNLGLTWWAIETDTHE